MNISMTIRTWFLSLATVVAGWFGLQLTVMRFTDAAPGALALFPAADFAAHLPRSIAIVGAGGHWIAVRSDEPNLGKVLYASGAVLVLPAGLPGCLPLP